MRISKLKIQSAGTYAIVLDFSSDAKIVIYDILGQEVSILVNEELKPGLYEKSFNAEQLSSGLYVYELSTLHFSEAKKMIFVK